MSDPDPLVCVARAAVRLGVPARWLLAEAKAGRVPALRAGRRLLVDPARVKAALDSRMSESAKAVAVA